MEPIAKGDRHSQSNFAPQPVDHGLSLATPGELFLGPKGWNMDVGYAYAAYIYTI